jgi:hypothetical protein
LDGQRNWRCRRWGSGVRGWRRVEGWWVFVDSTCAVVAGGCSLMIQIARLSQSAISPLARVALFKLR